MRRILFQLMPSTFSGPHTLFPASLIKDRERFSHAPIAALRNAPTFVGSVDRATQLRQETRGQGPPSINCDAHRTHTLIYDST